MNPDDYLGVCSVIDHDAAEIRRVAVQLCGADAIDTARRCFEFVRDQIRHSSDFQLNPVTCRASDVLMHGTGYCYAKSHLLCALLRANRIPAGMCYQRLTVAGDQPPFCLHGFNAVYLPPWGWYRIDPRGNRDGIDARFDPPTERLAFTTDHPGEIDLPGIYAQPLPQVVACLTRHNSWGAVYRDLPDVDCTARRS
ncbi:transglutaminase family protein [Stieleria sp. TO1_6]|uniref:transglutaminase-like domain-containing protein n=1 Tax=Stieleria tagensis TaxID=2956795 RepID=UPI00209B6122|nr:transglutaminase family protein [Stieleria tagensis]MCO8120165.1 transglutaminase family protein [Stieleria tagensis]